MKERILFLTTEMPYPLDNGGKIRTFNMIKSISDIYDIDLVCFSEEDNINESLRKLKGLCKEVIVIKKIYTNNKSKKILIKNCIKSILKNKPFIIEKFNDINYKRQVRELIDKYKYKCIILDHLQITNYINEVKGSKLILSQHNCEYIILKRRYENQNNLIKKFFIWSEYVKTKKYEIDICKNMNSVIVLSENDKKFLTNNKYDGSNIKIIPISVESTYDKKNNKESLKNILFLGTMSWYPNEQGILWFMNNVWNKLLEYKPDLNLYIVGSNPSERVRSYQSNNVIVTGYVESIDEYLEKCDICIIPLFIGGGMRVKILECMANGIPCISTSIGAEGIECSNFTEIIIANNVDEFIDSVIKLDDLSFRQKIAYNAKILMNNKYSIQVLKKKLIQSIEYQYKTKIL